MASRDQPDPEAHSDENGLANEAVSRDPTRITPLPWDAGPDTLRAERRSLRSASFHWILVLTCAAGALTLAALWAPILLASWMAMVVRPLHSKLVRRVKGSGRAAAVVTVLLVGITLAPLVIMSLSLFGATAQLVERVQHSGGASGAAAPSRRARAHFNTG